METITSELPKRDQVELVRLAVSAEAICPDEDPDEARTDIRNYFQPIADALGEDDPADITDEPDESEYDSEWQVYSGEVFRDVTVDQWLKIADGYCLDLKDDAMLPETVTPTMGILGAGGITPAVAIEHTDEGWGTMWHEPQIIASFYVALLVRD